MKKIISTIVLACLFLVSSTGCAAFDFSNDLNDQQRLASIAITYESVLDGLIAARTNGVLDDDAYRRVDPLVDTIDKFIFLLKEHVDSGQGIDEDTYDRVNRLLDAVLAILIELDQDEETSSEEVSMQIENVLNFKQQWNTLNVITI